MATRPGPPPPAPPVEKFSKSLEDSKELLDLVRHLLEMREDHVYRLLRATTSTGFRRIHEHLTSAIDRAIEICLTKSELDEKSIGEITLLIARGLILVNYQEARGQLNRDLADRLKAMITRLLDILKTERKSSKIREVLESMRTLIDALAVLVYKYTR